MNAIDLAVEYFGSQTKLAQAIGLSTMAVSQWRKRGIPPTRCIDIERATDGAISRGQLRPDLWPSTIQRPEAA